MVWRGRDISLSTSFCGLSFLCMYMDGNLCRALFPPMFRARVSCMDLYPTLCLVLLFSPALLRGGARISSGHMSLLKFFIYIFLSCYSHTFINFCPYL